MCPTPFPQRGCWFCVSEAVSPLRSAELTLKLPGWEPALGPGPRGGGGGGTHWLLILAFAPPLDINPSVFAEHPSCARCWLGVGKAAYQTYQTRHFVP